MASSATEPDWRLRCTLYYTALESDYAAGSDARFRDRTGNVIHRGSEDFMRAAEIEGSARLSDGRSINVDGRVDQERRWKIVQGYGLDAVGCQLVPFRSVAVDRNVVPLRTKIRIPRLVGMPLPDGTTHDGIWFAVDTGGAIQSDRIDLFLGAGKAAMETVRSFGVDHLETLDIYRIGNVRGCSRTP
ncbi:MAG: hypothetical protein QOI38_2388 [Sphingomonadales bacterium]|nr:hypothetical protein [Sphingomonadales bacterium]